MKKLVSIVLAVLMVFALFVPTFAVDYSRMNYPVIRLGGNGNSIYDGEGNVAYPVEGKTDVITDGLKDVIAPLIKGLTIGKYDDYYAALEKLLADYFGSAALDPDGNPVGGTDIHNDDRVNMANAVLRDTGDGSGTYGLNDYHFWFDWRLDPMAVADELNDYINAVLKVTGKDKVIIYDRCLGSCFVLAYLGKYGPDKVAKVCFNGAVANGAEFFTEAVSGDMKIDFDALMRYTQAGNMKGMFSDMDEALREMLLSTVRMLNANPSGDVLIATFKRLLEGKFGQNVNAIFMRACYATWPGYWAMVRDEDYERSVNHIFGKEGTALRQKYAGLVEKLDGYHEVTSSRLPEILKSMEGNAIIIAKYGSQGVFFTKSNDELSDETVSLRYSSFGATTSKIGKTLSDEYIAERTEQGLGKYISVDKQVDASTCILPETTWITKGVGHEDWPKVDETLARMFFNGVITDINSDENYPQFLYWDRATDTFTPLTEENMNCEAYYDFDTGSTSNLNFFQKIKARFTTFFDFIKKLFAFIGNALKK